MPQVCTQCRRVNPQEASYCYFDGALLAGRSADGRAGRQGSQPFPTPFVFPSGLGCRNFDQLAMACQQNWKEAVELLKQGFLASFLGGLGRADLALAAQEAAGFPDLERGLDQLLSKLPTQVLHPPKLKAEPSDVNLGVLPMGADRTIELHLCNQGMRLLYGSVVSDNKWLTLGEAPGNTQKLFQFGAETVIPMQIRGQHLRAGAKVLEGNLVIESNGGSANVRVRAEVPVSPFRDGVLAGAISPRQVAEKAMKSPQTAAPLFEKGAVAQWFTQNGWQYPVQGPAASGLGAVQQFFEALGLAKAPKIEISPPAIQLKGQIGQFLSATIKVFSKERRPVYAYATGDQPWLDVGRAKFEAKNPVAAVPVQVHVPNRPGETLQGNIRVTGNGNQRFVVPLALTVEANPFSFGQDDFVPVVAAQVDEPIIEAVVADFAPVSPSRGSRTAPALVEDDIVETVAVLAPSVPVPASLTPLPSPVPVVALATDPFADMTLPAAPVPAVPVPAVPVTPVAVVPIPVAPIPVAPLPATSPATVTMHRQGVTLAPGSVAAVVPAAPTLVAEAPSRRRHAAKPFWVHLLPLVLLALALVGIMLRDLFLKRADIGIDPDQRIEVRFDYGKDGKTHFDTMTFGIFKKNLPEPRPARKLLDDLVTQLGHEKAAADKAAAELEKYGLWGRTALKDALSKSPAKDTRDRIDNLLAKLEKDGIVWLTFDETGRTNSTVLKLDNLDKMFGDGSSGGTWKAKPEPIYWGEDAPERLRVANLKDRTLRTRGMEAKWMFAKEQVLVTQTVELIPGEPVEVGVNDFKRLVDTCRVRYKIDNLDDRPHRVGMRFLLDTLIGENDEPFFIIPGSKGMVDRPQDFTGQSVPSFVQAVEKPNVRDPGNVALLNLRVAGEDTLEPPSRLSLTRWPGRPMLKRFDVPMTQSFDKDSAVIIYWDEKELGPKKSREMGFTYGLYNLQAEKGRLGVTVAGDFSTGGELTVVALVNDPGAGEQLTLKLPADFTLVKGAETQSVPAAAPGRPSSVTWHIRSRAEGTPTLEVLSSTGDKQTKRVRIRQSSLF